jgi:hypothetical protein
MKFDLKKPCLKCPFKKDTLKGWLGKERSEGIINHLLEDDGHFTCHETIKHGKQKINEQHCAGAMILLEKNNHPNQAMRIAERLRLYNRHELDMNANVFDTGKEFINRHM